MAETQGRHHPEAGTAVHGDDESGKLVIEFPQGWELGHEAGLPAYTVTEYVPEGDDVENWDRLVTVNRIQLGPNSKNQAFAVASLIVRNFAELCEVMIEDPVGDAWTDGYLKGTGSIGCEIKRDLPQRGNVHSRAVEIITFAVYSALDSNIIYIAQYAEHFGEHGTRAKRTDIDAGVAALARGREFLQDTVTFCTPEDTRRTCR